MDRCQGPATTRERVYSVYLKAIQAGRHSARDQGRHQLGALSQAGFTGTQGLVALHSKQTSVVTTIKVTSGTAGPTWHNAGTVTEAWG